MPEIGSTGVAFTHVAREWRCKYAMDDAGTPAESSALKACEALLKECVLFVGFVCVHNREYQREKLMCAYVRARVFECTRMIRVCRVFFFCSSYA